MKAQYHVFLTGMSACLLLSILSPASAFAWGDLQISCPPGVKIYVDGDYKGTSSEEMGGLFIDGLAPGVHKVRAVLPGRGSRSANVAIKDNMLTDLKLSFSATGQRSESIGLSQSESVRIETGTLEIRSVPPFPKADIYVNRKKEGSGDTRVLNIPCGKVPVEVRRGGKSLRGTVRIKSNTTIKLKADWRKMTLVDIDDEERRAKREEEELRKRLKKKALTAAKNRQGDIVSAWDSIRAPWAQVSVSTQWRGGVATAPVLGSFYLENGRSLICSNCSKAVVSSDLEHLLFVAEGLRCADVRASSGYKFIEDECNEMSAQFRSKRATLELKPGEGYHYTMDTDGRTKLKYEMYGPRHTKEIHNSDDPFIWLANYVEVTGKMPSNNVMEGLRSWLYSFDSSYQEYRKIGPSKWF